MGTQLAIKYMGKAYAGCQIGTGRGGVVLNLSSVQGLMSWPAMPVYSAGKAGIIQFTRCAGHALEYASHAVKIVCLCPYGVDTGMNDFHPYVGMTETGSNFLKSLNVRERILSTEEVAQAGLKVKILNQNYKVKDCY
jgi:NAD(P)-dependent dehydrogenase (short-subunit alcohol dehydrogenase family)